METREIAACMANGSVTYTDRDEGTGEMPWNPHPVFKGVYLKHIVRGADTGGMVSCHMVKIDPQAVLEEHDHGNQWELHEVLEGEGTVFLGSREAPYCPGRMGVIPKGVKHRVVAGEAGLLLLAKFFPALM